MTGCFEKSDVDYADDADNADKMKNIRVVRGFSVVRVLFLPHTPSSTALSGSPVTRAL